MDEQLNQAVGQRGVFDLCFDTVSSLDEKVNFHNRKTLSHQCMYGTFWASLAEASFRGSLVLSLHRHAFFHRYFRDTFQQQHHMGSSFTLQKLTVLDAVDQDRVFR